MTTAASGNSPMMIPPVTATDMSALMLSFPCLSATSPFL